jgi:hypothetical protein
MRSELVLFAHPALTAAYWAGLHVLLTIGCAFRFCVGSGSLLMISAGLMI